MTLATTTPSKAQPMQLQRLAVIYVRQSSPVQVEQHAESRHRQYQLAERAHALGWPAARCLVIDDDLGISGAQSHNRPGYQRLVSLVALREVGVIFGLEVSRLARNCLDWYQLLELAAAFGVLIGDEDGLYDPGEFNDRLLLGLKGTFSEIERYQIMARMQRGRLNKARRGALALRLPVGFDYDPVTGEVGLTPDQAVRHAIAHVFERFAQLGSLRAVLRALRTAGLQLPHRVTVRGLGSQIEWRRPSYDKLYAILTNPTYAGVYRYGGRAREHNPLTRTTQRVRQAREDYDVFLPNHHPAYVTLDQYEANMAQLHRNRTITPSGPGAAREGSALLQGLVWCQRCGRRMRVQYSKATPYYCCDKAHQRFDEPICGWASAVRVDALVEDRLLSVVDAGAVDLALAMDQSQRAEHAQLDQQWRDQLQRLDYACELARRRYELVDPANRLVAQTLETAWNDRLTERAAARAEYARRQQPPRPPTSTPEQMRQALAALRQIWHSGEVTPQDKKELLRCVIERVHLATDGKVVRAEVVWQGGARSHLDVPKYLGASSAAYQRVRSLAQTHTDAEIAAQLNHEGLRTMRGKDWTPRRVMDFRLSNAIPSGLTASTTMRQPGSGYVTSAEAAVRLGVEQTTIQQWFTSGLLSGKQDATQRQLWIAWSDDLVDRLGGDAVIDPGMVSVRRLCRLHGKRRDEILAWAVTHRHRIVRVRRGTAFRFYVRPRDLEPGPR